MKEWSQQNQFNSFNSMKGVLYRKWYEAVRDWRDGKIAAPLPPVEVSLDPIHVCNLYCQHCNFHKYLADESSSSDKVRMTDDHICSLIKFLAAWGVKSICFGGGGEPTLHTRLGDMLVFAKHLGLHNSIATNGTAFTDELVEKSVASCRWIGVSVDSATPETYEIGRKANYFTKTIENIKKLAQEVSLTAAKCDIGYKFLIFSYNQHEIYQACQLARELGARDFHARPADFRHQGLGEWKKKNIAYDFPKILEQFEKCHELETKDFRVFTVTHKFNEDFTPRRDFSGCYGAPVCIQLCADGKVYHCPDTRHIEYFCLGNHYPDPREILKVWGGEKHYNLIFGSEAVKRCGSRCTFGVYNLQAERLVLKGDDPMCWQFP